MEQQLVLFPLNRTNNVEGTMIEGNQVAKEIFFGGIDKRMDNINPAVQHQPCSAINRH